MLVVVGLGNPGSAYAASRHNVGFGVVDAFRRRYGFPGFDRDQLFELSRGSFRGHPLALVRPQIYMNRSGEAVRVIADSVGATPEEILVIVDDVHLPVGRLRLRRAGGDGGHNGLRSVIDALGSQEFPRLRLGVGGPSIAGELVDFVLGDFTPGEAAEVDLAIDQAVDVVATALESGIDAAMNRFNALPADPGDEPPSTVGGA